MVTVVTGEFSKFRAFCETSPWMIFIYMILDILVSWQRQMHLNFSRKKQQSICHLFSFHHFLHACHVHVPRHPPSLLHLLHHGLNPLHTSNRSQHLWVHCFGHGLVNLAHFVWIKIFYLFFVFEEFFYSTHLFNNSRELLVLI